MGDDNKRASALATARLLARFREDCQAIKDQIALDALDARIEAISSEITKIDSRMKQASEQHDADIRERNALVATMAAMKKYQGKAK